MQLASMPSSQSCATVNIEDNKHKSQSIIICTFMKIMISIQELPEKQNLKKSSSLVRTKLASDLCHYLCLKPYTHVTLAE